MTIPEHTVIAATFPNGGESWQRGTTKTITWTKDGNTGSYVKIDLYNGGAFKQTIVTSTPNDSSHHWAIPIGQTLGTDYNIKITSTSNSAYVDTSNNNFIISSTTSPVGDIDGNNQITASDALLYLRHAVGQDISPYHIDTSNDVTCDGIITAADSLKVLRKAVGQDVSLEC